MAWNPRQRDNDCPNHQNEDDNSAHRTSRKRHIGTAIFIGCSTFMAASQFNSFPGVGFLWENSVSRKVSVGDSHVQPRWRGDFREYEEQAEEYEDGHDKLPAFITDLINKKNQRAYSFDPYEVDYDESDLSKLNIRKWGCERRNEAPFIFVHIGKAGGGSVRARMAASAKGYNRSKWTDSQHDHTYYYPIMESRILPKSNHSEVQVTDAEIPQRDVTVAHLVHKGVFANSKFSNFRPSYPKTNENFTADDMAEADLPWKTFERTLPCSATTPLGQAIACPLPRLSNSVQKSCRGRRCDLVYTGHNLLGSELHWLPTEYLARWWYTTPWAESGDVESLWRERAHRWYQPDDKLSRCHFADKSPAGFYKERYHECVAPREDAIDAIATLRLGQAFDKEDKLDDWSPIYASLPVLRVTMMREPFSWLVSKFFWHKSMHGWIRDSHGEKVALRTCDNNGTNYPDIATWVSGAALKQINHLCGEDCIVRMNAGIMSLDQVEQQARHKLQHAFAVVGLLNETETFYEMVTARAKYMDTSLNPEVTGSLHSTSKKEEYARCSQVYQTKEFQENLLAVCPELRVLKRLYQVAMAVNRFQQQEMRACGLLPEASSTPAEASSSE